MDDDQPDHAGPPLRLDGRALAERFAAGELDAAAVTERAFALAEAPASAGTFTALTRERAVREARRADRRYRTGRPASPLDGVPFAVKDVFDVAGTVTTAGSRTRSEVPPAAHDSAVVRALAAAGMVCVGKTNMSEFAFSGLGVNPHFGTPVPPGVRGEPVIPGGSSSGSAVAVALGVVPVAIGTDTSGSVRVPAAFCGVIGYKAGERRYSTRGMLPLAPTLDTVGVFATSMRDIIAVDSLLRLRPDADCAPPSAPPRLVVPVGELLDDCTPEVRDRFAVCLDRLAEHGVEVEERRISALVEAQSLMDRHATIVEAEAYRRYGRLLGRSGPAAVDPGVLRRLAGFAAAQRDPAPVYRAMGALRDRLRRELGGALLACPAVRHTAPPLAPLLADDRLYDHVNRRTLRTTMVLSYLGMPGVTLPIGPARPKNVGLLLSAAPGGDATLLASAAAVETMLGGARGRVVGDAPPPGRPRGAADR